MTTTTKKHLPINTGSSAERNEACPPAGLFGRVMSSGERARNGTAIHEHLRDRALYGVDEAMARLPALLDAHGVPENEHGLVVAMMRKCTIAPAAGSIPEVSLAIARGDIVGLHAERVRGGRGHYDDTPPGTILATQIDLLWSEPEPLRIQANGRPLVPAGSVLWVVDYKTGTDAHVTPATTNLQLQGAALAASLWCEWDGDAEPEVSAAVVFTAGGGEGTWDTPGTTWGSSALARIGERLVRAHDGRVAAWRALLRGEPPRVHEGAWCAFCPSADACPAKVALVRAIVAGDLDIEGTSPLTIDQLRRLPDAIAAADRFGRMARAVLRQRVDEDGHAIDIGGGLAWGPVTEAENRIEAEKALGILGEELGAFAAEAISVSRGGIEDAVAVMHEAQGVRRQKAAAMRRIMAKLRDAGALRKVAVTKYKVHRPGVEGTPADEE